MGAFNRRGDPAVLVLRHEPDETWVDNLAVSPRARGRGLSRSMLERAELQASARGASELRLLTHELMTENRAIYEHLGWERIATPPDDPFPRVHYRRSIRSGA